VETGERRSSGLTSFDRLTQSWVVSPRGNAEGLVQRTRATWPWKASLRSAMMPSSACPPWLAGDRGDNAAEAAPRLGTRSNPARVRRPMSWPASV